MDYCAYYDKEHHILDYLPTDMDAHMKSAIDEYWNQDIPRKILLTLSEIGETNIPTIREQIGHSMSTLHENIVRLEQAGLISTKITYVENKKKTIMPKVLFVTKSPKFKVTFRKFFQGMWINSKKNMKVTEFLQKYSKKYFTAEEISSKVKLPVDEVEILLSNWDSPTTRTLSTFLQEKPFEKKVLYRGIKKTKKK